ncbi:hypothetical protein [Streptomyces cellulosae]|uniref:Uncharacterized protein n=1 Tax=Streptomyces cellulosae TaxID=1968 RepID=A0ABW7YAC3_STRCE
MVLPQVIGGLELLLGVEAVGQSRHALAVPGIVERLVDDVVHV